MKSYYIFLPDSKTALELYGLIKQKGIKCTMAPTPREADACCGVSILYYKAEDKRIIEETSKKTGLSIQRFWECENDDNPERNKFC